MASYLNLLVSSSFITILYPGGWHFSIPFIPNSNYLEWDFNIGTSQIINVMIGIIIVLIKAYLFLFISIMTRWTLPRVRMDQLLDLGWKFLLPIALGNLLLTASFQVLLL